MRAKWLTAAITNEINHHTLIINTPKQSWLSVPTYQTVNNGNAGLPATIFCLTLLLLLSYSGRASDAAGELVVQTGHGGQVRQVMVSPALGLAASRGDDNTVRIWDIPSRMLVRTLAATNVETLALAARHPWLIWVRHPDPLGEPDVEQVDLTRGETGKILISTNFFNTNSMPQGSIYGIALSPDDRYCAVAVNPGPTLDSTVVDAVYVFDCTTGLVVNRIKVKVNKSFLFGIESLAFAGDSKSIYLEAYGALQNGSLKQNETDVVRSLDAQFPHASVLAVSPKGDRLALLECQQPPAPFYDTAWEDPNSTFAPQQIAIIKPGKSAPDYLLTARAKINSICFSPSGDRLYAGTSKGTAAWDLTTGRRLPGFKSAVTPNLTIAATTGGLFAAGLTGNIGLLDAETGQSLAEFRGVDNFVEKILFSTTGGRLWILRGNTLIEWRFSGENLPPVWGGEKSFDWLRESQTENPDSMYDVANSPTGEPVLLLRKNHPNDWTAASTLVAEQGDKQMTLPTSKNTFSTDLSARLSADGTFAFVTEDNLKNAKQWRIYNVANGKAGGQCVMGALWAEDHSASKPRTALGFEESLFGSHLVACNLETGENLWTNVLKWDLWLADPNGHYLVFVEQQAADLVVVDLQNTNAPSRLPVPMLRELATYSLFDAKFTFRANSPVLDFSDGRQRFAYDLRKVKAIDPTTPAEPSSPAVQTATVFNSAGAEAVSPAAGLHAIALRDGSIELGKLGNATPLARLITGGNTGAHADYLVIQPNGYYAASPGAADLACLRFGLSAVSFDEFDLAYNRPDLVLAGLGMAKSTDVAFYQMLYQRRLAHAGGSKALEATAGDRTRVEIDPQSCPIATGNFLLNLPVGIFAGPDTVTSLVVAVNDRWLSTNGPGQKIRVPAHGHVETNVDIPLGAGENVIDIWVVNSSGIASRHRRVIINRTSPPPQRTLYLIAVGVSHFQDTNFDLRYADKDAQDMDDFWHRRGQFAGWGRPASWTQRDEQYGFDKIQSLVLTNELVTREALEKSGDLIRQAGVDDLVIISFSGHGLRDPAGTYYFATHDIDFARPQGSGFSERDLENLLARSGARENLLLLDTCDSGEAEPGDAEFRKDLGTAVVSARTADLHKGISLVAPASSERHIPLDEAFRDLRTGSDGGVIAASGSMDFALEDPQWKNGVFTYAFLHGLQNGDADLNQDTSVSFSELCQYMQSTVSRLTQGRQHPTIRENPLAHDLIVLKYPSSFSIAPAETDGP